MPPVNGGSCGSRGVCRVSTVSRSAWSGSPSVGTPTGGAPSQCAWPSRTVSAAELCTPTKEYRDQVRPFSADSSRKVPGRPPASLRYRPTGVSPSASSFRVTGITRRSFARTRKVSRSTVVIPGAYWRDRTPRAVVRRAGAGAQPSGRAPASKQVRSPVWQAAPVWSTRTSTVSPSQSSATERTCWTWPEVSPLTQYAPRLRLQ
jgi:hypothetical protein